MHQPGVLAIAPRFLGPIAAVLSLILLFGCGGAAPSASAPSAYDAAARAPAAEAMPAPMAPPGEYPASAPPPSMPGRPAAGGGSFPTPAARSVIGAPAPAPKPAGDKSAKPDNPGTESPETAPLRPAAPLLIYVGSLVMQIDDIEKIPAALDKVIDIAESLGGYLTARTDTTVEVRVPSQRFREALTTLEKIGDVTRRSVTAEDVSEQYHDLEVRLANLKAVQKRLQEFLAKAHNIQDTLTVERELERVGAEIDQIEGKMRFLRSRAAFSVITVEIGARSKSIKVVDRPNTPPDPRAIHLPIEWLSRVGLNSLLSL